LKKELKNNLISPRTYSRKEKEIEKWVNEERKELNTKKKRVLETVNEMGTFL
jgi:hypothetical protein